MHIQRLAAAVATCAAVASTAVYGQGRGGANWTTNNNDAQRTSWVRTDPKISKESMGKAGLQLLWKLKLERAPQQLNALTAPITIASIGYGFRGIKALAFLGGSSGSVYGVDYEIGRLEWTTHLNYSSIVPPASSSWNCPGGLIAGLTRPTTVAPAAPLAQGGAGPGAGAGGGGGRGGGGRATSAVGEPGQGAVTIGQSRGAGVSGGAGGAPPAAGAGRLAQPAGPNAAPSAGGAPGPGQRGNAPGDPAAGAPGGRGGRGNVAGGLGTNPVVAVASDGLVHVFNPQNGVETIPPVEFLPPNAAPAGGLILADNVLYAAVASGCGGVTSGVWAVDLTSQDKKPVTWTAASGSIVGTAGPALGANGTVYVAVGSAGSAVVALESKTLRLKDSFSEDGADFTTSPVVFSYKDRELLAAAGGDGKLYLLDAGSLGGADHKTPLHATPAYAPAGFAAGALASWQDADGTRWVLAPSGKLAASTRFAVTNGIVTNGAVVAFKVTEQNGNPALEPVWVSRDMTSPFPPIVVNGVVFVLSSGESRGATSAASAVQRSVPAVLYALDATSGKTLWSSGTTVTSFAHSGGLAASPGQIYFVTFDGTLWAFGVPTERE